MDRPEIEGRRPVLTPESTPETMHQAGQLVAAYAELIFFGRTMFGFLPLFPRNTKSEFNAWLSKHSSLSGREKAREMMAEPDFSQIPYVQVWAQFLSHPLSGNVKPPWPFSVDYQGRLRLRHHSDGDKGFEERFSGFYLTAIVDGVLSDKPSSFDRVALIEFEPGETEKYLESLSC